MKDADPSPERDAMRQSYTTTLQSLYLMAAVVAGIASIASFWTQHYDLDQAHDTDHGMDDDASVSTSSNGKEFRMESGGSMAKRSMCTETRESQAVNRAKSLRRQAHCVSHSTR